MEEKYLNDFKRKINELSEEEKKQRDLYLKRLGPRPTTNDEKMMEEFRKSIPEKEMLHGPTTGYASIDKPGLYKYTDKQITSSVENNSFYGYLYDCCNDYPNEISFTFEGYQITKRQLFQKICQAEDMLRNEKGIKKDDLVSIAPVNQPESIFLIYALNKIGAKVSVIDPRANANVLKQDLLESNPKPRLFIASSTAKNEFMKIENEVGLEDYMFVSPFESHPNKVLKSVVSLIGKLNGSGKYPDKHNYSKLMKEYSEKKYPMDTVKTYEKSDGLTYDFIMHTGGTTGVHKGVELTGRAFNNTVMEHNALMDGIVFRGDMLVNPMPQFITYGMTTMHLALCKGFNMNMLLLPSPKSFTEAILKNKARLAYGGPVHWEGFAKSKLAKNANLDFLRVAVAGGEKINLTTKEELNKFFKERNCNNVLIDGYGLSEVTGVFSVALNENTIGSQGQPLPHNYAGVFDRETGKELQYGEVGELFVSSESMMDKYHENPEETENVIYDDNGNRMMKTGDAAFINEYGEINIVGRYKRIFVCGVDKVYQERMEEVICELPFVDKCVITRIPVYDEDLKAVPKAHIILKEEFKNKINQKDIEKIICDYVAKNISDKVVPRYFEVQDSVIYTPNGKVDFTIMTKDDQIKLNKLYPGIVREFVEVDKYASSVNVEDEENIKKR